MVDYEPLPPSMDAEAVFAREHGGEGAAERNAAVLLFPERGSDILKFRMREEPPEHGPDETVVTLRLENNRMAAAPLESQAILAEPPENGKFTVWLSSQGPHETQRGFAASLGLDPADVRVVSPWVGGGFGGKGGWVPEHIAVAGRLNCWGGVRWLEDRTENLLSMYARHQIQYARLSVGSDGKIASLETHALADCGGYLEVGGLIVTATVMMAQGVHRIPQLRSAAGAACTNKAPTTAFRGAGRPQATCILERVMDVTAVEMGIDPVEMRLRNLLQPEDFPVTTPTDATYDTGRLRQCVGKGC